jgi:hypothetical protein
MAWKIKLADGEHDAIYVLDSISVLYLSVNEELLERKVAAPV